MKTKNSIFFLAVFFSSITTACGQIGQSSYNETETGLKYKFYKQNTELDKPAIGDILTVSMKYFINDSLLFDGKTIGRPMQFPLVESAFKGDFYEGMAMMAKGDSASFICPADSVFLKIFRVKSLPEFVSPESVMRFEIGMENFLSPEEFEAERFAEMQDQVDESNSRLLNYIQEKNIKVEPQPSGLYYVETLKGTGKTPVDGQRVKVHYRGTLLDGTQFDASYDRNQPFEFVLGMGQVIKGWDEGIALMQVGGKATLILPFNLAYGERATGTIPPFSPLVFEVELIEIIK
jgi:FKBP-type peptidyl-prolyl cis-trans isomerase FkpA